MCIFDFLSYSSSQKEYKCHHSVNCPRYKSMDVHFLEDTPYFLWNRRKWFRKHPILCSPFPTPMVDNRAPNSINATSENPYDAIPSNKLIQTFHYGIQTYSRMQNRKHIFCSTPGCHASYEGTDSHFSLSHLSFSWCTYCCGKHSFTAYPEKKFVSYHAFVASLSIVLWKKRCITRQSTITPGRWWIFLQEWT